MAKVSDFGLELSIEEDVFTFDAAMDNREVEILMQICKPSSYANNYVKPMSPIQGIVSRLTYMIIKCNKQSSICASLSCTELHDFDRKFISY